MTDLPEQLMDRLHAEALTEDTARQPYCTGDRCADCTAPTADDPDEECCEATCGCCPRVNEQDWCWLGSEQDDGSRYCSQHGEGMLLPRSPEAERMTRSSATPDRPTRQENRHDRRRPGARLLVLQLLRRRSRR